MINVAIIGSSGAIGRAFILQILESYGDTTIHAFSRLLTQYRHKNVVNRVIDCDDEESIANAAAFASKNSLLDLVIVATGILHDDKIMPEKSLRDVSVKKFQHLFTTNAILPAILAKHFIPKLNRNKKSVFAVLSARVGSITENQLGGWYSYRVSKAALNMIIKNTAIETSRKNKQTIIIGLHPGTVDSSLSRPFQDNIPKEKLFSPEYSVRKLLLVLDSLDPSDSGKCFAWDGNEIKP